jgi:hypothetical protein
MRKNRQKKINPINICANKINAIGKSNGKE